MEMNCHGADGSKDLGSSNGEALFVSAQDPAQDSNLIRVFLKDFGRLMVQLKGDMSEPQTSVFVEARHGSPWFSAIEERNCRCLMDQLEENPALLVKTGLKGRTVWHVAVIQGCLKLVNQILNLFGDQRRYVLDAEEGIALSLNELMDARDGRWKFKILDIADDIFGYKGITVLPRVDTAEGMIVNRANVGASIGPLTQRQATLVREDRLQTALRTIIGKVRETQKFGGLENGYDEDVDYNFIEPECVEFRFHHACKGDDLSLEAGEEGEEIRPDVAPKRLAHLELALKQARDFVQNILDECRKLPEATEVLQYLFHMKDAQGRTPVHVAVQYDRRSDVLNILLKLFKDVPSCATCVNVRDAAGKTPLHHASTLERHMKVAQLARHEGTDLNATYGEGKATALHLAILHNYPSHVKILLSEKRTDVNAVLHRKIGYGYKHKHEDWRPLQLAAVMGQPALVKAILGEIDRLFDVGKHKNSTFSDVNTNICQIPALHLAAASGNPQVIRVFLDNPKFNPMVKTRSGRTALHFAVDATTPCLIPLHSHKYDDIPQVDRFIWMSDFTNMIQFEAMLENVDGRYQPRKEMKGYSGKQGCINMLLQAGVDIWQMGDDKSIAEPGPEATDEDHRWWYEKISCETFQAKSSLNDAGNAIAVIAGLIAAASYVGPLQPPPEKDPDKSYFSILNSEPGSNVSMRLFMVSNSVSFYLAIAAIMFAVAPSLPMPQEGLLDELRRTQNTVALGLSVLIMSIVSVLVSFAAALSVVTADDSSYLEKYPSTLAGFMCILGVILFFLRLLRLIFHRNVKVRQMYQTYVKI